MIDNVISEIEDEINNNGTSDKLSNELEENKSIRQKLEKEVF